jgi:hypothetical protein
MRAFTEDEYEGGRRLAQEMVVQLAGHTLPTALVAMGHLFAATEAAVAHAQNGAAVSRKRLFRQLALIADGVDVNERKPS